MQYGQSPSPSLIMCPLFCVQLDLVCGQSFLAGTLMSMHFAGFLVGCYVTGQAADTFGRRTVSMLALLLMSGLGTSVSFVWNLELMLAMRFLLGIVIPVSNCN